MMSLLDVGVSALTLNGISYTLLKIAGVGGSSIVYKARLNGCSDYCMIKEFYPYDLTEGRETDGTVRFLEGKTDAVQSRKSRAIRESEIAMRLRYTEENNDPWILQYEKPIQKNNTLYTIITTEKGEMLSERISDGYYVDKDFTVLCDCILAILDALEPIHDKGYLHLDISPDNIHCSKLNIMRMIDYNSAYSSSNPSSEFFPSFKRSYSAPELKRIPNAKSFSLSPATDLFSVAAIFFTMLKGRPIEENDWAIPSRWFLNNEEGYLKGASTLLIDSTNAFLKKNLSRTPKLRLQSVAEMRAKIEELKKLRQRIELENSPKRPNAHFVCRDKEISYIDEYLQKDKYVILEGIGGIGKTELAKKYAWENREKYDIVQFITYTGDLQTTVAFSMNFHNFDTAKIAEYESKYGNEAVKYIYRDKISSLNQDYHGKRTLIVVDNYNTVADDHFAEFVSGNYKVIFTSREKHDGNTIEITEMTDEGDLMKLFSEYYALDKLADDQVAVVLEIIGLVLGHTMTLMLIATAMQKSLKTPAEMLARLQNGLDPKLRTKIAVDKEGISSEERENVVYEHIRNLFNMEEIIANDNYSVIMTNMAIIPYTGVAKKTFYIWALSEHYKSDEYDDEDYTDMDSLIDHRWIQYDGETHHVSLHPIISDLAYRELKPDSVKCSAMIKRMNEYAEGCFDKTHIEIIDGTEMLGLACKRIADETELTTDLYMSCAELNNLLAQYSLSLELFEKSLQIRKSIFNKQHPKVAESYSDTGGIYLSLNNYEKALEYYTIALSILRKNYGEDNSDIAIVYNNMGKVYYYLGNYKETLKFCEKSLKIHKQVHGGKNLITAQTCNNIGAAYKLLSIYNKAEEYYGEAHDIMIAIDGDNTPSIATLYNNYGRLYIGMGDYAKALEFCKRALEIRKNVFAEDHPDVAASNSAIGIIYSKMGEYDKSLEHHKRSLDIHVKIFGEEHSTVAVSYESIGVVYNKRGDNEKALYFHKKALAINMKVFGEEHPDIANSYSNIGTVYYELGKYEIALEYLHSALKIVNGADHENTSDSAAIRRNIASVYTKLNDYANALKYYRKALSIYKSIFPDEHPYIQSVRENISTIENQAD